MKRKYVLKGLLLAILLPLTLYYFLTTPGSEVTISSLFIIILAIIALYDEITITRNKAINRNKYQLVIDRTLSVIFVVISIDVLISFFANGISIWFEFLLSIYTREGHELLLKVVHDLLWLFLSINLTPFHKVLLQKQIFHLHLESNFL